MADGGGKHALTLTFNLTSAPILISPSLDAMEQSGERESTRHLHTTSPQ